MTCFKQIACGLLALAAWIASSDARVRALDPVRTPGRGVLEVAEPRIDENLAEARKEIIQALTADELRAAINSPKHGVSIAAAWERARRGDDIIRNGRAEYFLGVAEGRLKVALPSGFARSLKESQSTEQFWCPVSNYDSGQAFGTLEIKDSRVTVGSKDEAVLLKAPTNDIHDKYRVIRGRVCWYLTDADSTFPSPYRIRCFSDDGDRQWDKTIVWASRCRGFSGSGHMHEFEVVENDQLLVAFGASVLGYYIEAFRRSDGVAVCRFDTQPTQE